MWKHVVARKKLSSAFCLFFHPASSMCGHSRYFFLRRKISDFFRKLPCFRELMYGSGLNIHHAGNQKKAVLCLFILSFIGEAIRDGNSHLSKLIGWTVTVAML